MSTNNIMDTDSYKASHPLQYPPKTTEIFSYLESRVGGLYDRAVFFGLQGILRKIAIPVTMKDVEFGNWFFPAHGEPFPLEGWKRIVNVHGGRIPVKIRALPEGIVAPAGTPLLTVKSTDPELPWLNSWIETRLMRVWYPTTVATISWMAKKIILESLFRTSDDPWGEIDFKLQDFGSRGSTSEESAAIGGAAHLVNFQGSDTVVGVLHANDVYRILMSGFSIPASEHSAVTAWGLNGEIDHARNMLKRFGKKGQMFASVCDTYDLQNCVQKIWGEELRQSVIDSGATLIMRPDSGSPPVIVPEVLKWAAEKWGYTLNKKGFKVLNHVRGIQGDGLNNPESIGEILKETEKQGFSTTNISFGMGAGLLQKCDRDTMRFKFAASHIVVNGEQRPIHKAPKTDLTKTSKSGRLDVRQVNAYDLQTVYGYEAWDSAMRTVFLDGEITEEFDFAGVRKRARSYLEQHFRAS